VKHLPVLIAAAVVAFTLLPTRPAVEVGPVRKALASASSSDRAAVAGVYRALADVTKRDQGQQMGTTAIWRSVHSSALRLAVGGTPLVGKYKGLDTAVESVLGERVGLENVSLTSPGSDGKPVYEALAGACEEVARQAGGL